MKHQTKTPHSGNVVSVGTERNGVVLHACKQESNQSRLFVVAGADIYFYLQMW